MRDDPARAALLAALRSPDEWVRTGAASALAESGDAGAVAAIRDARGRAETDGDEWWLLTLALARLGDDVTADVAGAIAIDGGAAALDGVLGAPADAWDAFWGDRRAAGPRGPVIRLMRWRRLTGDPPAAPQPGPPTDDLARCARASGLLEGAAMSVERCIGPEDEQRRARELLGRLVEGLRADDDRLRSAAEDAWLSELLTDPSGVVRFFTAPVLCELRSPRVDAALVASLLGDPPVTPGEEQVARTVAGGRAYGPWEGPSERLPMLVAQGAAQEVLEETTRPDLAWAVVQVALRGEIAARARAEAALSGMRCETSLPALFWAALETRSREESDAAARLVEEICAPPDEHDDARPLFRRIGDQHVVADLAWFVALLDAARALPAWSEEFAPGGRFGWTRGRETSELVLRHALLAVPMRTPPIRVDFFTAPAWDTLMAGLDGVRTRFRRLFGLGREAAKHGYAVETRLPYTCAVRRPASLDVLLRATGAVRRDSPGADVVLSFPGAAPVDLVVLARSATCTVTPPWRPLRIAPDDASAHCAFELVADATGKHRVEIEILHGAEQVYTTDRDLTVVDGHVNPLVIVGTGAAEVGGGVPETRAVVHVDWTPGRGLDFSLVDAAVPGEGQQALGRTLEGTDLDDVREWSHTHAETVRQYASWTYRTDEEVDAALDALTARGLDLFRRVVPPDLQKRVVTWAQGSTIAIETNESWIPWELLCHDPRQGLWGDWFQVIRLPRAPTDQEFVSSTAAREDGAPASAHAEVRVAVAVIGDGIPVGNGPGRYSPARTFPSGFTVRQAQEPAIKALRALAPEADILHLTCHGRSDPDSGAFYLSLGPDLLRRLLPQQVATLDLKPGAVVFANACSSGESTLALREFVGFGWLFYGRGARPFIGTLGAVPADGAFALAQSFYEHLLVFGMSAPRALRAAKDDVRRRFRNPLWALYCVYGLPASVRLPVDAMATGPEPAPAS